MPSGIFVSGCGRTSLGFSGAVAEPSCRAVSKTSCVGVQVGQAGNAALAGAGAEGHQDLRLPPHQLGHVILLAGADAAVEEGDVDAPSAIFSTSRTLPSAAPARRRCRRARPRRGSSRRWRSRDFAAAAGGRPVDGQLSLALVAHAGTSIASGSSLTVSRASTGRRSPAHWRGHSAGRAADVVDQLREGIGQSLPFGGGGPDNCTRSGSTPTPVETCAGASRSAAWPCSSARCSGTRPDGSRRSSRRRRRRPGP